MTAPSPPFQLYTMRTTSARGDGRLSSARHLSLTKPFPDSFLTPSSLAYAGVRSNRDGDLARKRGLHAVQSSWIGRTGWLHHDEFFGG